MLKTKHDLSVLIIRIMVGSIFLSEGIQKFLYPSLRGVGRFIKIDLPWPEFLAYFVASFEVICGLFILIGLFTRFAAVPLIIIMLVAIASTKIPILMSEGFWVMAHAARTDWAMLLGSVYLLLSSTANFSLDNYLSNSKDSKR